MQKNKSRNKILRQKRTRAKIAGGDLFRLSVFRSLKHFYAQIIDDKTGKTLCAASDKEVQNKKELKPIQIAESVGKLLAQKAKEKNISGVVFDRGSYQYHGRVKAAAEGARKEGLNF
jgi:large subunit ribosomal protein L18